MTKISAVILTNRCDERLMNAIESVQFVDEIIIFDYQSNCNWSKIQKNYTVKIIKKKYRIISDFSKERNSALKETSNEWVLFLDSDEVIPESTAQEINTILSINDHNAFSFKRVDIFYNKKLNWGEVKQSRPIRLINKASAKYMGRAHEKPLINGSVYHTNLEFYHYAHNSITEFLTDITHYAQLIASERSLSKNAQNSLSFLFSLIFFPPLKLIYNLSFNLALLDGWRGLIYAYCMSIHSLAVRVFQYEQKNIK